MADDGTINLVKYSAAMLDAYAFTTGDEVMISGTNSTWDGFHTVTSGCAASTRCTQIVISGTTGVPASLVGAVLRPVFSNTGITDLTYRWNWARRGAAKFTWISFADNSSPSRNFGLTAYMQRIKLTDNLYQSFYESAWVAGDKGGFISSINNKSAVGHYFAFMGHAMESIQVMRNTLVDQRGSSSQDINGIEIGGNQYGVRWKNDLIHYTPGQVMPGETVGILGRRMRALGHRPQRGVLWPVRECRPGRQRDRSGA